MFDRNGKSYRQLPVNEAAKVLGRTKALAASITEQGIYEAQQQSTTSIEAAAPHRRGGS